MTTRHEEYDSAVTEAVCSSPLGDGNDGGGFQTDGASAVICSQSYKFN